MYKDPSRDATEQPKRPSIKFNTSFAFVPVQDVPFNFDYKLFMQRP